MYDRFGEMNSSELNELATNMKGEGNEKDIYSLVEENGLDKEDVEDFISENLKNLSTPLTLSLGHLKLQKKESKLSLDIKVVIYTIAESMLMRDKLFQDAFCKRGKNLDDIYKELEKIARENKSGNVGCAAGTDRDLEKIIYKYYEVQA